MFDSLAILSAVSLASGIVALVATFASVLVAGWLSIQNKSLNQVAHITFGLTQLALMAQMMTAVLFLALDMTQKQSLVYYLAGFTAVAGFMLFYWWPTSSVDTETVNRKTRRAMVTAVIAFLLAVTGLTVGADVAYMAAAPTSITPLQVKEFSATTWTARPAQTVLCMGCESINEQDLKQLDALAPAELVRFTGQTERQTNVSLPTADEQPPYEEETKLNLSHPLYTLIAFMGFQP